jgi:hypothetical protein
MKLIQVAGNKSDESQVALAALGAALAKLD